MPPSPNQGLIHPTAIIDPSAEIEADVQIGPRTLVGAGVTIGSGTIIGPHVVIEGPTRIGRNNRIHRYGSIGAPPQDTHYRGEQTLLEIGDDNVIHDHCSLNRGTTKGGGVTRIGDRNVLKGYVHIAHDCQLGNDIYLGEFAALAGHVVIGDHARLERLALIHQYCRIGIHSLCPTGSAINRDVPPYVVVTGKQAVPRGINSEGLRRRGFDASRVATIREAYRVLYRSDLGPEETLAALEQLSHKAPDVARVAEFVRASLAGRTGGGDAIAAHRGILTMPDS